MKIVLPTTEVKIVEENKKDESVAKRRVALAFMRYDSPDKLFYRLYRTAIAKWTKGPYSHVELVYIDEDKRIKEFTADPKEGKVRIKDFEEDLNTYCWDFVVFDITEDEWFKFQQYMEAVIDDKYDWLGIFGFILPIKDRETNWFCSEVNSNFLKILGVKDLWKKEPSRISPNLLKNLALKMKNRNVSSNIEELVNKSLTRYNPEHKRKCDELRKQKS